MTAGPDLIAALATTVRALDAASVSYAAIGGLARNAWGTPRTTTDLDFELAVDADGLAAVEAHLSGGGLLREKAVGPSDPADGIPDLVVYRSPPPSFVRVDLLVAKTPFQVSAVARRVLIPLFGTSVWIVRPEDLVVYKLVAFRGRDQDDIQDVLDTQAAAGARLEWDYITAWASEWGVGDRWLSMQARLRSRKDA